MKVDGYIRCEKTNFTGVNITNHLYSKVIKDIYAVRHIDSGEYIDWGLGNKVRVSAEAQTGRARWPLDTL
ncbi:hypothetical protein J6590_101083, partial [Homalodisca vitripennis]